MGAGRVLLQRGLRLNADCADMWREYVRLELGFVEALRRRWDVLGISLESDSSQDRESRGERIDREEEAAMGDTARRAIMDGAIVRQAIDGAAKGELSTCIPLDFYTTFTPSSLHCLIFARSALPTIELFQNLQSLIAGYPVPESLRNSLLDDLHARLAEALPYHAAAVALRATRALAVTSAEELAGGALVDALRRANEEMLAALDADGTGRCPPDELAGAYVQFVEEWCRKEDVDADLVRSDLLLVPHMADKTSYSFCALDGTLFQFTVNRNCTWWAACMRRSNANPKRIHRPRSSSRRMSTYSLCSHTSHHLHQRLRHAY